MFKNLLRFTSIISAFAVAIHSPDLGAQDAVSFIPKNIWQSHAQRSLLNQSIAITQELGPIHYESAQPQFKVVSNKSVLNAKLSLSKIATVGDQPMQIQIHAHDLKAIAHNFGFTAVIQKDLGFGLANIRLNVECDSVQVESLQPITVQAVIDFGKQSMSFDELKFRLAPEALRVSFGNCTEVSGFDEMLKAELVQMIKSEVFTNFVKDALNQKANAWITEKMDQAINSALKKYYNSEKVQTNIDQGGDLWIISNHNDGNKLNQSDLDEIKKNQKPVIVISRVVVEKQVAAAINQKLEVVQISSDTSSGLRKITCSRFYQFFLWPSLMSLAKCFPLQFVNRTSLVKLIDVKNMTFEINIDSWAQNKTGVNPIRDLAFFQTRFQTDLFTERFRLLSFSAKSFQAFITWARASGRISSSFIKSSVETVLTETINEARKNVDLQNLFSSTTVQEFRETHIMIELAVN